MITLDTHIRQDGISQEVHTLHYPVDTVIRVEAMLLHTKCWASENLSPDSNSMSTDNHVSTGLKYEKVNSWTILLAI